MLRLFYIFRHKKRPAFQLVFGADSLKPKLLGNFNIKPTVFFQQFVTIIIINITKQNNQHSIIFAYKWINNIFITIKNDHKSSYSFGIIIVFKTSPICSANNGGIAFPICV